MLKIPTYPPSGEWDPRMNSENLCPSLMPVKTVHQNEWFAVKNRGGYFTTEFKDAQGVILPIVDKKSIVLVRVIRPVIEDNTLELPAGGFALSSETPEQGLMRELAEETGIIIKDECRMIPLAPIADSPGRNPNLIYPYRVDLSQNEFDLRLAHDDEIMEVICLPFEKVSEMIKTGKIYVAGSIAVILRYFIECNI